MLRSTLKLKINSNQEMREYTEKEMIRLKKLYQDLETSKLQEKINNFLLNKKGNWLKQIMDLLSKNEYCVIKGLSDELVIINNLCEICDKEYLTIGQTTIEKFSSLETMRQIYQETIFYLRRMEFDMEEVVCEEFIPFMNKWNLSMEYIKMVLEKGEIHNKKKVKNRLVKILEVKGYLEYSVQLMSN